VGVNFLSLSAINCGKKIYKDIASRYLKV